MSAYSSRMQLRMTKTGKFSNKILFSTYNFAILFQIGNQMLFDLIFEHFR